MRRAHGRIGEGDETVVAGVAEPSEGDHTNDGARRASRRRCVGGDGGAVGAGVGAEVGERSGVDRRGRRERVDRRQRRRGLTRRSRRPT